MNRQELFNMAYVGLAKQGFVRSVSDDGRENPSCRYRGPEGRKCAIGHCIPDKEYSPLFEGYSPGTSLGEARDICVAAGIGPGDVLWAATLQRCHDYGKTPADMRGRLESFARSYNLSIPELPDDAERAKGGAQMAQTLSQALEAAGIHHEPSKIEGKQDWFGPDGEFLGSFDAAEGWEALRASPANPPAPFDEQGWDSQHMEQLGGAQP